jgi:hypothetical protein
MPRKPKTATNGTALANVEAAAPLAQQITRSQANAMLKSRALELYHEARTRREEQIRLFEAECGRVDRLDHTILAEPRLPLQKSVRPPNGERCWRAKSEPA